jgi:hypothetical protein
MSCLFSHMEHTNTLGGQSAVHVFTTRLSKPNSVVHPVAYYMEKYPEGPLIAVKHNHSYMFRLN